MAKLASSSKPARKLTVRNAKPATVTAKPVTASALLPLGTAAAVQAVRSNVAAPAAKPAKPGKPVAASTVTAAAPAKPIGGGINRTASTIAKRATHFGITSDRDCAYLTFYAGVAKRSGNDTVTLSTIVGDNKKNPLYLGSNKAHDAGVINRLHAAGLIVSSADGHSFTFTPLARTHAAYAAGIK